MNLFPTDVCCNSSVASLHREEGGGGRKASRGVRGGRGSGREEITRGGRKEGGNEEEREGEERERGSMNH